MIFLSSMWILLILPLILLTKIRILCSNDKKDRVSYEDGFFEALQRFDMRQNHPDLWRSGTCFSVNNVSAIKRDKVSLTIILTVEVKSTTNRKIQFCRNDSGVKLDAKSSEDMSNNTDIQNTGRENHDSILAVSQTVGIVICGILLTIFFFIAGIMRIKNFLRRNKSTLKINGLRSCLTTEEDSTKWHTSLSTNAVPQQSISNCLQLQSVMDRSVGQFMIKPSNYSKSSEQECKKTSSIIRRKTSIKNKLIPKRLNHPNSQRRYSLSNEIDSVMNKHFNMIGVARKSGYRSTQNIGSLLQRPVLSQNSIINDFNVSDQRFKNQTLNGVSDSVPFNKVPTNRYYRNNNFPCRRATTIGARSNHSKKFLDKSSPPVNGVYSSQHSMVNTQSRNLLSKQRTLDEGKETYEGYLLHSNSEADTKPYINSEPCYLKVPPKPLNLVLGQKSVFNMNYEKTSPSQESVGSNSRCSSVGKTSSTWGSLDVQDPEVVDKAQ